VHVIVPTTYDVYIYAYLGCLKDQVCIESFLNLRLDEVLAVLGCPY